MRTKTFLLSAAVLAAGLSASVAQSVFSVNAVGYVNITVVNGNNLIANPLNGTNNNINTVIPTAPAGSTVTKWNGTLQQLAPSDAYLAGTGWVDENFAASTTTIAPGEAFFFQNPGATATLTFVGEVPQGNLVNPIGPLFGFYSSIVPQSASLPALSFPAAGGMVYNAWDRVGQKYGAGLTFLAGTGWVDENFANVDPVPAVGEGFLITNPGGAVSWTRTFSVN